MTRRQVYIDATCDWQTTFSIAAAVFLSLWRRYQCDVSENAICDVIVCFGRLGVVVIYFLMCDRCVVTLCVLKTHPVFEFHHELIIILISECSNINPISVIHKINFSPNENVKV